MDNSRKKNIAALFLLVFFGVQDIFIQVINAAEVNVIDGRYNGEKYVSIVGTITAGDLLKVKDAAKSAIHLGNNVLTIHINTTGGDLVEAMKIGEFARELMATTYVYGRSFYAHNSEEAKEATSSAKKFSQSKFNLKLLPKEGALDEHLVKCYSACIFIFYGGVNRYASDNLDFRLGYKKMKKIPVVGIHRPYFEKASYSKLSPSEANKSYKALEEEVRVYMASMGAPQQLIDRMFKKSSSDLEFLPSEEFKNYYNNVEPFIEEWKIAKCGSYGPKSSLDKNELSIYKRYEDELKKRIDRSDIKSIDEYDKVTPVGIPLTKVNYIKKKIENHNAIVMSCRETAIRDFQKKYLPQII